MADEGSLECAPIHAGECALHGRREETHVRNLDEVLGDPPEMVVGDHPPRMPPVKGSQVHWARVSPQCPFASQVDIHLEVAHHQLSQTSIHGLAIAQPGVARLGDGAPAATKPEDGDHMVQVLGGLEVKEKWRQPENAECGGGEDGALKTVGRAKAQDTTRRPGGRSDMVRHGIERSLDPIWISESAQAPQLERCERTGSPRFQGVTRRLALSGPTRARRWSTGGPERRSVPSMHSCRLAYQVSLRSLPSLVKLVTLLVRWRSGSSGRE